MKRNVQASQFKPSIVAAILAIGYLTFLCNPSRAANIVLYVDPVTGGIPGNARDLAMYQRLTNQGHSVTVILDSLGQAADIVGKDAVLISSSVGSGDMAAYCINTLRTADIGVVNIEPALFDEMLQAPNNTGPGGQTSITIAPVGLGHPLAAGKSGSVVVASAAGTFSLAAGTLGVDTIVIATGDQGGNAPAIFAQEQGSRLSDNTTITPKRRVGFFMNATTGTGLFNSNAFDLFDAAINWVLPTTAPVGFSAQPQETAVLETRSATFSCVATGAPPYSFQWYKNDVVIDGATSRTYIAGGVELSDNGSRFYVVANNAFSSATSRTAILTVNADTVVPTIVSVRPDESFVNLLVTFSEPVLLEGAVNASNYQFSGGLVVSSAMMRGDMASVVLRTATRQAEASTYTLTVNGIIDRASSSNRIAANSQMSFTTFLVQPGFLRRDVYTGIPGVLVSDLISAAAYPYNTDSIELVRLAEGPVDVLDNYGSRIAGYVIPPVSGDYKFYMSSDDGGELWLSTDDNPANATRIAFEPVWNGPRDWTGVTRRDATNPENQSVLIPLTAGVRYYMQALMKEQTGGDNLGVTWQAPGEATPVAGAFSALSNGVIAAASPVATITISQQPQDAERQQGRRATFSVAASVNPAKHVALYQWQTNGIDIPGANASSYTTPLLTLDDNGLVLRCIVTAAGAQIASTSATLTVIPDVYPPALLSALRQPDLTNILLTFSEDMEPVGVLDTFNYGVCDVLDPGACLAPVSITPITGSTYMLTTSEPIPGVKYQVSVFEGGVLDLFNNSIMAPSNSVRVRSVLRAVLQQDVDGYAGCQDTELRSNLPTLASGGTNTIWLVDQNDGAGGGAAGPVQSLLRFDNIVGNGPSQVPSDAVVINATLVLVSTTAGAETANRIDFHRMLVNWNEATASWDSMVGGISSNDLESSMAIDVSFVPQLTVPFTIMATSPALRDTVKGWVEGTFPNYGWAVLNGTGTDGYRVDSSEHPTVGNHPRLVIDYVVPTSALEILPPLPPSSITLNEGDVLTIAFNVRGSEPSFQWSKGGSPISGANSVTYSVAIAHPSDSGTYHLHAENDFPSSVDSPSVSVSVVPDTVKPVLISANGSADLQTIRLVFSERLDAATANNAANYSVSIAGGGSVNVVSAMQTNGTDVVLVTDTRVVGVNYTVTVNNVADIAETPNVIGAPNNQKALVTEIRLLAFDGLWKYEATGTDLSNAWSAVNYNDSAWPSGQGLFGFEDTPGTLAALAPLVVNTPWALSNQTTRFVTYYTRTKFTFLYHAGAVTLNLRHVVDDGAVVYLNGTEAGRFNMPAGPIAYTNLAPSAAGEGIIRSMAISGLVCGENTLAVEIHQNSLTSSDVLFGAELLATVPEFADCGRLSIVNNSNGTVTLSWTGTGTLQQTAALPGGWADAPNQANPQTFAPSGTRFYRLRP